MYSMLCRRKPTYGSMSEYKGIMLALQSRTRVPTLRTNESTTLRTPKRTYNSYSVLQHTNDVNTELSSAQQGPTLPKKEFSIMDKMGSLKRIMGSRPLPPPPTPNNKFNSKNQVSFKRLFPRDVTR